MISDMPKPRYPGLQKQITRHKKVTWYVRKGRGRKIRIRGEYDSDEFKAAYHEAYFGVTPVKPKGAAGNTLSWLIERYQDTKAWNEVTETECSNF